MNASGEFSEELRRLPPSHSLARMFTPNVFFRRKFARPRARVGVLGICTVLLLAGGCSKPAEQDVAGIPASISFNDHVRPILVQNCTACHGGVKAAGGVSFIYAEEVLGKSDSGRTVVVPGAPNQSEMVRRIKSTNETERMPPVAHGDALAPHEIGIIEKWISGGANWEEHWAYRAPELIPANPAETDVTWSQRPLDDYVLAKMTEHGLSPSAEAAPERLLRRLFLDLVGVPPTWDEVQAFAANPSAEAYQGHVDALLNRPEFGERWATPWLDLARYADTKGYERDPGRDAWPFRDWVIRALNEDMPFTEFTRMQLAGDLAEEVTLDHLVATGFHRNSKTNVEGGSDDEEFRLAAVVDRVNTTWQAWTGTTFGCVQCHSHPYDPFSHESYFEFMALFDNTWDHDTADEYPTIGYALNEEEREGAFAWQLARDRAGRAYQQPLRELATEVEWSFLDYESATSTRGVTFSVERDEAGRELLQTGPNVPRDVQHTIVAQTEVRRIEALRIDALMLKDASVEKPGTPFVVSWLETTIKSPDGTERRVEWSRVTPDEFGHAMWPEESLREKSTAGWGAYPKQHYPRWAVFVPCEPLDIGEEDSLVIDIHNRRHHDGAAQPVLRRFQISLSDDPRWADVSNSAPVLRADTRYAKAVEKLADIEVANQPVMRPRNPDYARVTNMFIRGDWRTRGGRVEPAVPALMRGPVGEQVRDRASLVEWLVADENPLTARFTVNRHWEQLFGKGLMETLEDFGSASPPPSHPELLDYLAIKFRTDWGWSPKRLLREIVSSATYRQSAVADLDARAKDPRNVWLSRGPRTRLTGEMVRDNTLHVAGLLSAKMYGPPVMPVQPEGVWRSPYNKATWETSEGEDQYRRAVYTYWKRTVPYPSLLTFDAPSRDVCSSRRITTNTPLQALVTLNDPVYWECAQVLARAAEAEAGDAVGDQIGYAFRRAMLREPTELETRELLNLHDSLAADTAESAMDLEQRAEPLPLTISAMLNLDDFLTK